MNKKITAESKSFNYSRVLNRREKGIHAMYRLRRIAEALREPMKIRIETV